MKQKEKWAEEAIVKKQTFEEHDLFGSLNWAWLAGFEFAKEKCVEIEYRDNAHGTMSELGEDEV